MIERRHIYMRAAGILLAAFGIFLLLSMMSYSRADFGWQESPANAKIVNFCGAAGALTTHVVRLLIGTGGYLIALAAMIIGAFMTIARPIDDKAVRAIGGGLILLAWCGLISRIFSSGGPLGGHGGMLGYFISDYLLRPIGAGAFIIGPAALIFGAFLAADAWVLWVGKKGKNLVASRIGAMRGDSGVKEAAEEKSEKAPATKLSADEKLAEQKENLRQRLAEKKRDETSEQPEFIPAPLKAQTEVYEEPTGKEKEPRKAPRRSSKREPEATGEYHLPALDLLDPVPPADPRMAEEQIEQRRAVLKRTLEDFDIAAEVVEIDRGPVITQFELELAPGVKIGKIIGLSDDIARALMAQSVRVVAPIPGKSTIGIEVPNTFRQIVRLRELFDSGVLDRKRMTIPLLLGKDASGEALVADLSQMPHLLIAGATGSGKSVCMNSIIMTFLLTQPPEEVKLILIDPKMVELSSFRDIPHLMTPVLTDMKKAAAVLEWATRKMDERYSQLANVGVRNIAAYNSLGEKEIRHRMGYEPDDDLEGIAFHLPHIIIIIDELADLMMVSAKEVESTITRLAQKSRAVGIHLIVATQRPSVDVVTGLIKANLPSRLAFQTASKVDSRTILDRNGAEKLLGRGDMLFLPPGSAKLIRGQGAYTSDDEIKRVTSFLSERAKPRYDAELMNPQGMDTSAASGEDELYEQAVRIVLEHQRGSVSLLQRKLGIGYGRASRLIELMAETAIIGEYKGSQAREVLLTLDEWDAQHGNGAAPMPPQQEDEE